MKEQLAKFQFAFRPGNALVEFGKPLEGLYFIQAGLVGLYASIKGEHETLVDMLSMNDLIGAAELISGETRSKITARAVTEGVALRISPEIAQKMLGTNDFIARLAKYLAARHNKLMDQNGKLLGLVEKTRGKELEAEQLKAALATTQKALQAAEAGKIEFEQVLARIIASSFTT